MTIEPLLCDHQWGRIKPLKNINIFKYVLLSPSVGFLLVRKLNWCEHSWWLMMVKLGRWQLGVMSDFCGRFKNGEKLMDDNWRGVIETMSTWWKWKEGRPWLLVLCGRVHLANSVMEWHDQSWVFIVVHCFFLPFR